MTQCGLDAEDGIVHARGCTDILCVGLFLAFIGCMFGAMFYGIVKGEPKVMLAPYDFTGNICGVNKTVAKFPKLYMTKLAPEWSDSLSTGPGIMRSFFFAEAVCVEKCPVTAGFDIARICPKDDAYNNMCTNKKSVETTSMMDICWPIVDKLTE